MILLPEDMPGLREEAARLAQEYLSTIMMGNGHYSLWDDLAEHAKARAIDAQVALLRDLDRPASRD
jgi:hypothetical protein